MKTTMIKLGESNANASMNESDLNESTANMGMSVFENS
jgi:hypothetical protein